jgi:Domain of unknown function (DUF4824)
VRNRGLFIAGVILALGNAAILLNVARNRAGTPDAELRISEREAQSWAYAPEGEEGMLTLRLRWETAPGDDGQPAWFDRAKLVSLGFEDLPPDGDTTASSRYRTQVRPAYAVLELNGPAWTRWITQYETRLDSIRAANPPDTVNKGPDRFFERKTHTRLMLVDAGLDPAALRTQYPLRTMYLILPATISGSFHPGLRERADKPAPGHASGQVTQLLPGTLHVPRPLRDSLLALGASPPDSATHFTVTVKVGRQFVAWVE